MSGDDFKLLRLRLGMSQASIADYMGLRYKAVLRAEKSPRVPRLYELAIRQLLTEREGHRDVAA